MEMRADSKVKVLTMRKGIYQFIREFLDFKGLNSKRTAKDYENDIRLFFWMVKHRQLEMLTEEDLIITQNDVQAYQVSLATNKNPELNKGEAYASASIARKISSVKKLYSQLEANNYPVKEAWFKVDKIKGESESYGVLEWEEVMDMIELASQEKKGDIKSALLETAVITCFRQNSLLNLTWDNLKYDKKEGVWFLWAEKKAIGKGKKKSEKPIDDELYEKLMSLKEKYGTERIFPLEKKTVVVMMQRFREKLGLGEDITFHSLKKCGINEAYDLSGGDIMAVAEQGDHESPNTTLRHYMNRKKKKNKMIGLQIGKPVDLSPLQALTHNEIMDLISEASKSTQIELLNLLKKS